MTAIETIEITDDLALQNNGAIEVTISMKNGDKRWCFFMTPKALSACGSWIEGTQIPFHFNTPHMIVVGGKITEDVIKRAIADIDNKGLIEKCSIPI